MNLAVVIRKEVKTAVPTPLLPEEELSPFKLASTSLLKYFRSTEQVP